MKIYCVTDGIKSHTHYYYDIKELSKFMCYTMRMRRLYNDDRDLFTYSLDVKDLKNWFYLPLSEWTPLGINWTKVERGYKCKDGHKLTYFRTCKDTAIIPAQFEDVLGEFECATMNGVMKALKAIRESKYPSWPLGLYPSTFRD